MAEAGGTTMVDVIILSAMPGVQTLAGSGVTTKMDGGSMLVTLLDLPGRGTTVEDDDMLVFFAS